jgi:hypothetical protein
MGKCTEIDCASSRVQSTDIASIAHHAPSDREYNFGAKRTKWAVSASRCPVYYLPHLDSPALRKRTRRTRGVHDRLIIQMNLPE